MQMIARHSADIHRFYFCFRKTIAHSYGVDVLVHSWFYHLVFDDGVMHLHQNFCAKTVVFFDVCITENGNSLLYYFIIYPTITFETVRIKMCYNSGNDYIIRISFLIQKVSRRNSEFLNVIFEHALVSLVYILQEITDRVVMRISKP